MKLNHSSSLTGFGAFLVGLTAATLVGGTAAAQTEPAADVADAETGAVEGSAVEDSAAEADGAVDEAALLETVVVAGASKFDSASESIQEQLRTAVAEYEALQAEIREQKLPLSRRLNELAEQRTQTRAEYDEISRTLSTRALDLTGLTTRIKSLEEETTYLSGILRSYTQGFKNSLHIAEEQRYAEVLDAAIAAPDNDSLDQQAVFAEQSKLLDASLDRLIEMAGGTRFEGTAVAQDSLVKSGTVLLVGPMALFRSDDGATVGSVERRRSEQPRIIEFEDEISRTAAADLVASGRGTYPVDATLGNAHKIAATDDSVLGELERGGVVIYPIIGMASLALLVALFKWLALSFVRKPSRNEIEALLDKVSKHDHEGATKQARRLRGPVGRMLAAGVEHLEHPRELIEEAMYETVLTTRLKLNRMLPFIAICAASAPLLGLLGTVTGIINTFKQITLFGSGDVKMLSGGISEALITTKYGLVVAIPSLMLHAFLSRKARGIIGQMETSAVSFMNEVAKMPARRRQLVPEANLVEGTAQPDPQAVREQVSVVLEDLLGSLVEESNGRAAAKSGS